MSIRRRMTASLVGAVLILLGGAGAILYLYMRAKLERHFDEALFSRVQAVHALLRQDSSGKVELELSDQVMPQFRRSPSAEFFQIWTIAGTTFDRSESLGQADLQQRPATSSPEFHDIVLPDGRPGRGAWQEVLPINDDDENHHDSERRKLAETNAPVPLVLSVARDRLELDQTLSTIAWSLGTCVVGLAMTVGALVPWLVKRALRPLQDIGQQARSIDSLSLEKRFPHAAMPEELRPICLRLNDLLERLQESFERQRRFSADVAHELRTPIAELRVLTEVALKFPRDAIASQKSFEDALDVAKQMEMIVGTLLEMIADDTALPASELENVDLSSTVETVWRGMQLHAGRRRVDLHCQSTENPIVAGNGVILNGILGNLLTNAVEYSPEGSRIECHIERLASGIVLQISNPTSNLEESDLPHLIEPFWRKDPARTGNHHAGLGLSLVACYARRSGINLKLSIPEPGHFRATMELPIGNRHGDA